MNRHRTKPRNMTWRALREREAEESRRWRNTTGWEGIAVAIVATSWILLLVVLAS